MEKREKIFHLIPQMLKNIPKCDLFETERVYYKHIKRQGITEQHRQTLAIPGKTH